VDSVPIIGGTGALGLGLALRLARAGVPIVIGSRDAGRAAEAAAKVRRQVPAAEVEGLENAEAATRGRVVVLSVPFSAQRDNLQTLAEGMSAGQILLDATVPLVKGRLVEDASGAANARELLPDQVEVVSALHTVSAVKLNDLEHGLDEDTLVAGDSDDAKHEVAALLLRIPGLRPVDCGPLANAWIVEKLTPLLISVNKRYKAHAGIKLTGLPEGLW
jgi:8-hydroxy-5-deazaflavin:NADPH oxidoreductase